MRNSQLFHFVIRVPKEDAAFTYFQMEANEGLCFYSTLKTSLGEGFRDISIIGSICFRQEFSHFLQSLTREVPLEILQENLLPDGPLSQEIVGG